MHSINSPSDLPPEFRELVLRQYDFWFLTLNPNQCYLGYAFLWMRRSVSKFEEVTKAEIEDLFRIVFEYTHVVGDLWGAREDLNWRHYGNSPEYRGYMRVHLIPRYDHQVSWAGDTFVDQDPTKEPGALDPRLSSMTLQRICYPLREKLGYKV